MRQPDPATQTMPRRTLSLMNVAGYVITASVGVILVSVAFSNHSPRRWPITGLFLTFALLFFLEDKKLWPDTPRLNHLYLAIQTILITSIALIEPNYVGALVLFFMLSAQATTFFPWRIGLIWVGIYTAVTTFVLYLMGGPTGLISAPIYAAGYVFFAAFAEQTRQAVAARNESQRLLAELQHAHRRLQAYATQAEELAVAEERNRLAREMHDALGHRLTVVAVQLEGAARLIDRDPDRVRDVVTTVREQVQEALAELRQTVATLRASVTEDLSLELALPQLAAQFENATGLPIQFDLPESMPGLPAAHRMALYRALQETLTNVQRHAQASHVSVSLFQNGNDFVLRVEDDGVGPPRAGETAGFGLRGLRERAAHLGGDFALTPRPDGGTRAIFRIPVPQEEGP